LFYVLLLWFEDGAHILRQNPKRQLPISHNKSDEYEKAEQEAGAHILRQNPKRQLPISHNKSDEYEKAEQEAGAGAFCRR